MYHPRNKNGGHYGLRWLRTLLRFAKNKLRSLARTSTPVGRTGGLGIGASCAGAGCTAFLASFSVLLRVARVTAAHTACSYVLFVVAKITLCHG
jgi:hypothetical protein